MIIAVCKSGLACGDHESEALKRLLLLFSRQDAIELYEAPSGEVYLDDQKFIVYEEAKGQPQLYAVLDKGRRIEANGIAEPEPTPVPYIAPYAQRMIDRRKATVSGYPPLGAD